MSCPFCKNPLKSYSKEKLRPIPPENPYYCRKCDILFGGWNDGDNRLVMCTEVEVLKKCISVGDAKVDSMVHNQRG